MKLKTVTFTGADDSVDAEDLIEISQEFPFVEWGILLSKKQEGGARFPSRAWMQTLAAWTEDHGLDEPVKTSAHLCGQWLRDLIMGEWTCPHFNLDLFQRVQLNFHREIHAFHPESFLNRLRSINRSGRKLIFQIDGVTQLYPWARSTDITAAPLLDTSSGAGILPETWPSPIADYCGYAGGLGPDNIGKELPRIAEAAAGREFWIDMETLVRSDNDRLFDLDKARRVIDIVAPFVED
jgi:hypothetical protein